MFNNNNNYGSSADLSDVKSDKPVKESLNYDLDTTQGKYERTQADVMATVDTMEQFSQNNPDRAPLSAQQMGEYKGKFFNVIKELSPVSVEQQPVVKGARGVVTGASDTKFAPASMDSMVTGPNKEPTTGAAPAA